MSDLDPRSPEVQGLAKTWFYLFRLRYSRPSSHNAVSAGARDASSLAP